MTRGLLFLALALFVGPAAAQPSAPDTMLTVTTAEFRTERSNDAPVLFVMTDGTGRARVGVAAGHGGVLFLTVDGRGYLVVEDGRGESVGRQEVMAELMAADEGDWRRLGLGLGRQRIEIAPRGTETILGVTGQVYAITLIEDGRRSAPYEVVISTDPRLAGTGRELLRIYDLLRPPLVGLIGREPQPYTAFRALLAQGTPIRIGPHYRLREFGWREIPAESFALPGPVLDRPAFVAFLRRQLMREPGSDVAADVPEDFNESDMANAIADAANMVADDLANVSDAENEAYADNETAPD